GRGVHHQQLAAGLVGAFYDHLMSRASAGDGNPNQANPILLAPAGNVTRPRGKGESGGIRAEGTLGRPDGHRIQLRIVAPDLLVGEHIDPPELPAVHAPATRLAPLLVYFCAA